jgi:asparagine synthase (glutamine-hydrolysing)
MCGFVGYFGGAHRDLAAAALAIKHRGPDMSAVVNGRDWAVAFNRLSILDLSEDGMQPFKFDDVTVYLNGEIYNYVELRDLHRDEFQCRTGSDVEIVPFLYRKYGLAFLHQLNGMFAMVIIDERSGKRFLIRDRFGKKPLYYRSSGEQVQFASEVKAIKQLAALRPDRTNVALNLACWFLIQPLSLYEGVFNVNPGCYLEVDGAHSVERRWYEPQIRVRAAGMEQIKQEIFELYRDSVRLRLRSDVPIGIYLSGGLDSVSMAQLALEQSSQNFHAFTARIKDKQHWELNDTDTTIVDRYCSEHNLRRDVVDVGFEYWNQNIVRIAGNYEELFTDLGVLVFYALAERARQRGVKVLFSGVGGDESFGGYPWQGRLRQLPRSTLTRGFARPHARRDDVIYNLLCRVRNGVTSNRVASLYRLIRQPRVWHAQSLCSAFNIHMRDVNGPVGERIDAISAQYFDVAARAAGGDAMNAMNYANVFTVLGNQNFEVDVASMKHSVENRSPLLDYRLVEYMLSVADSTKTSAGHKGLMRHLTADLVPTYVSTAKKSGPTLPVHLWLADPQFRRTVHTFLARNSDLIAATASDDLASSVRRPSTYEGRNGALMTFALISLVIWARQQLNLLATDSDISFTQLAQES